MADCSDYSSDPKAYKICAAEQGNTSFQYELGLAAFQDQDYKTALKWFEKAAAPKREQQNYLDDMDRMSEQRSAIPQQKVKMVPGHDGAIRMLIRMYEEGIGVKKDLSKVERYKNM